MIRLLAGLLPAWAWFAAAAVVLALTGAQGWRSGAAHVQAEWDKAELSHEQAQADQVRENARISRQTAASFERWRAEQNRKAATLAKELHNALQRPVACPASGVLADVPIPAAVVDGLRGAGTVIVPPEPPAAIAGPGLRIRP